MSHKQYPRHLMVERAEWFPCEDFSLPSSACIPKQDRDAWLRFRTRLISDLQSQFPTYGFTIDQESRRLVVTRIHPDGMPVSIEEPDPLPEIRYHSIDAYRVIANVLRELDLGEVSEYGHIPVPRKIISWLQTHVASSLADLLRSASDPWMGHPEFDDRDRDHVHEQFTGLTKWIESRFSDGTLLPRLMEKYQPPLATNP